MTFPKDPFTRKTYGRIVVHDEKDVVPVFEILKAIDPEEVANYMPDNLIAPIGTAVSVIYLHKFEMDKNEIQRRCLIAGIPVWLLDNCKEGEAIQ